MFRIQDLIDKLKNNIARRTGDDAKTNAPDETFQDIVRTTKTIVSHPF